jgi:aspartyl-tRNA(Asn)/glutamyl-tRNA(Gln) amidotransferase subunit C
MSQINEDSVKHIAKLARLSLNTEEIQKLSKDLSEIVHYVEQLGELNTENIEPMVGAVELLKSLREDIAIDQKLRDEMLKNAPDAQETAIKVPQMS